MFNIFSAKRHSGVEVVKSAKLLLSRMGQLIRTRQAALDALGDSHGDVDLRMVDRIDDVLVPLIGSIDDENAVWFQSMDWHGDGIRHLEFQPGKFPMRAIPQLQALLVDEYAPFCILCWAPLVPGAAPEHEQGLVIFSDTLLMTPKLASAAAAGV